MMSRSSLFRLAIALLTLLSTSSGAATDLTVVGEAACKRVVNQFEESMSFARKSMGFEKAAQLKQQILSDSLESQIFAKDGYCGLARHLESKKKPGK